MYAVSSINEGSKLGVKRVMLERIGTETATSYTSYIAGITPGEGFSTVTSDAAVLTFTPEFDYYVDSVAGSDSYSGTAPTEAYATIAKLGTIAAGTRIGLAKGSTWLEQMTIEANSVTVKAYGTGAAPIIDASDIVTGWTQDGTYTHTYTKAIMFASYDTSAWMNAFEDGAFMVKAANVAACEATAGTYWSASSNPTGEVTVYIHPTGDADPATSGKVYRVPVRAHCIDAKAQTGITIEGITCQRAYHQAGSIKVGDNCTITNCSLLYGNSHNVLMGEGGTLTGCTIKYHYYGATSNSYAVFNKSILTGGAGAITNCTIGEDAIDAIAVGFYCHKNTSGEFGTITISGCTFQYCGVGITAFDTLAVNISSCIFTNCLIAARIDYPASVWTVSDCDFTSTADAGNIRYMSITSTGAIGITLNMTDCTYISKRTASGAIFINKVGNTTNLLRCTFDLNTNQTAPLGVYYDTTGSMLTMNYCEWISDYWQQQFYLNDAGDTYTGDHNIFSGQWGFYAGYKGTSYNNIATWRAATSQDTNSTVV